MKFTMRVCLALTAATFIMLAHSLNNDTVDCCTGLASPFSGAACFPFLDTEDNGLCKPIWINTDFLRRADTEDSNLGIPSTNTTIEQPTSENTLARRAMYFDPDEHGNPQEVCIYQWKLGQQPCMNRKGRSAKPEDCLAIERFWTQEEWRGVWIITPPDIAGQYWKNLFTHDTCTFSFGNKNPPVDDNVETRMGNLDIARIVHDAVTKCGTGDDVEYQAKRRCVNFSLYFWVTRFAKFDCCAEGPLFN